MNRLVESQTMFTCHTRRFLVFIGEVESGLMLRVAHYLLF